MGVEVEGGGGIEGNRQRPVYGMIGGHGVLTEKYIVGSRDVCRGGGGGEVRRGGGRRGGGGTNEDRCMV